MFNFVTLISRVAEAEESATEADPLREALDVLLDEWPLCFGYWKRRAELEFAHASEAAAVAVYERAVVPCAYSVDMWALYCAHAVKHWAREPDRVRALFERAAVLVGSDFAAEALWDKYLAFEAAAADAAATDQSRVAAVYVRILSLPLKALDVYWARFQQFAATRSSRELLDESSEASVTELLRAHAVALPAAQPGAEGADDGARKLRVIALLEARFGFVRAGHRARLELEGAVRRRYFHVKPLSQSELLAWSDYLAWEEVRTQPRPAQPRPPHVARVWQSPPGLEGSARPCGFGVLTGFALSPTSLSRALPRRIRRPRSR
jgi:pre-mRNA-processing factor 39